MHVCAQPTKYQSAVYIDLPTCFDWPEVYYKISLQTIIQV